MPTSPTSADLSLKADEQELYNKMSDQREKENFILASSCTSCA